MIRLFNSSFYKAMLCVVALNYAAFRLELFENEYQENHPAVSCGAAFTLPLLTWETFDKNNAPEAFTFDAAIRIEPLSSSPVVAVIDDLFFEPRELVRDKSPPLF